MDLNTPKLIEWLEAAIADMRGGFTKQATKNIEKVLNNLRSLQTWEPKEKEE